MGSLNTDGLYEWTMPESTYTTYVSEATLTFTFTFTWGDASDTSGTTPTYTYVTDSISATKLVDGDTGSLCGSAGLDETVSRSALSTYLFFTPEENSGTPAVSST